MRTCADCPDLLAVAESIDRCVQFGIVHRDPEVMAHMLPHYQEVALNEFGMYDPTVRPGDVTWEMVQCVFCRDAEAAT